MTRLIASLVIAAASALPISTAQAAEPIRVGGTGAALGLMRLLGEAYEKQVPNVRVVVTKGTGSGGGIKGVAQGLLDVAVSSRSLAQAEEAQQLVARRYAQTPYVVAAAKDFPVDKLASRDLARFYATAGAEVVPGQRVRPVLRPATAADTKVLRSFSPEVSLALDAAFSRPGMLIANTDGEAADMIESTPGAIGPSTLGLIRSESRRIKILMIDGRAPDGKDAPHLKQVYLVTKRDTAAGVQRFVDFLGTKAAHDIATAHGFSVIKH